MNLKTGPLAGLSALVLLLSACSNDETNKAQASQTTEPEVKASHTLAQSVAETPELSNFGQALKETGLSTVFDGTASYTVLAPTNEAFGKLGDAGKTLLEPEQRAALSALIKSHVLPGYFTPKDISAAIAAHNGQPVEMRSMGNQTLRFTKEGENITVTSEDGSKANLIAEPVLAGNGVALPVDAVVKLAPSALSTGMPE